MSFAEKKEHDIQNAPSDDVLDVESDEVHKMELLNSAAKVVRHRALHQKTKKREKIDWGSQGAIVMGGILFMTIVMIALIGVMRGRSKTPDQRTVTEGSLLPKSVIFGGKEMPGETFVGLEATRTEKNPGLVAEIQKVIDSGGMPGDVFRNNVPPEKNVASELSKSFDLYRDNPAELNILRDKVPRGGDWCIDKDALEEVGDVLTRMEQKRLDIRDMLQQEDVCFFFEFEHGSDEEAIPRTDAADLLADYLLLEEFTIAKALQEGNIEDAITSLAYVFRLAQLAAEVKSPVIRTRAAEFRIRAVDILQTILLDPNCKVKNAQTVFEMLQEQLDAWTPDAAAWVGDRASGMKVFNLVRQYGLKEALEPDEVRELVDRGLLKTEITDKGEEREIVSVDFYRNLADDEVYYLQTMQRIIESCDYPYYNRNPLFNRIESEGRTWRNTLEEKVVSTFLLRYISDGMRRFALDRAKCEMATLALAKALNKPVATKERPGETLSQDPLFGRDYEVRRIQSEESPKRPLVWVSFYSNIRPFRVPDFTAM